MEFQQLFDQFANSPLVQNIITFITGGGLVTLAAIVLKLVANYGKFSKTNDSAVTALKASLEELKAKAKQDEEIQKIKEELDAKLQETNQMLKLLTLNATNPAVRQKAIEVLLQGKDEKTEDLIVTPEVDLQAETKSELSQLGQLMSHFTEETEVKKETEV